MFSRLIIGVFVSLLFLGCSVKKPIAKKVDKNTPTIEAKPYQLISFGRTKIAVPKKAKILLKDGEYAGYAGCNIMSGKYDIDLIKKSIKFYADVQTKKKCADISLENKFRKYLNAVDNYDINNDIMMLKVGDIEVLNFREQ